MMLYFFRKVYSEIVTAIPNNGGCYNAFLNTSPKILAGMVSCLSILSYVATALVASYDAVLYLALLWPGVGQFLFISKFFSHIFNYFSFFTFLITFILKNRLSKCYNYHFRSICCFEYSWCQRIFCCLSNLILFTYFHSCSLHHLGNSLWISKQL